MYKLQNKITGIIPDTHIPGHIEDALEFTQKVFYDKHVQQVVHTGDLVDHHYISRWPIELDALSPKEEWFAAKLELQRWVQAYPKMHICVGNHDDIPRRRLEELGIPDEVFLKSLNDIYGLPDTWIWAERFLLFKSVIIEHGLGSGGMYGAKNTANKLGVSYIQAHTHAYAAVFHIPRAIDNAAAMNAGCLIDAAKYYSRYGQKYFKVPVSLGCGVVYASDHMEFYPYRRQDED
jgi:predicted phosphodiesterase